MFGLVSELTIQAENCFNAPAMNKQLPELIASLNINKFKKHKISLYLRMKNLKLDPVFSEFLRSSLGKDFSFKLVKIEKYNMHGYSEVTISVLEQMLRAKNLYFSNVKFSGNMKGEIVHRKIDNVQFHNC